MEASKTKPIEGSAKIGQAFNLEKVFKDWIAGSISGICTVLVGHPFETAKTRIQMLGGNLLSNLVSIVKKEGFTSLYKGVLSPLSMMPLLFAVQFTSYGMAQRYLAIDQVKEFNTKVVLAGCFTGFCCAFVLCPMDIVKMKLQMEGVGVRTKRTGTYRMFINTIQKDGFMALYRGFTATLLRDMPSRTILFAGYEFHKRTLMELFGDQRIANLFAGGLSSFTSWLLVYPTDIVKTRVQCSDRREILYHFKDIYSKNGLKGFYKGVEAPLTRSLITGSVTFFSMETAKSFLYSNSN